MKHATNATAVLAALGLLGAVPAWAQSAADQPSSETAPTGGYEQPDATMGAPREAVSDNELRQYVEVRRALQQNDPEAWRAVESGESATTEQSISTALAASGSSLSVEEFEGIHEKVQSDASLRARIEQETGTSGTETGRSGADVTRPGAGAPLPSGPALGTGPASVNGGTPPGTQQPAVGAGAPAGDQNATSGGSSSR
jgi:hypothetical protein